jgi:methylated-DNA-[protein]-cysteine S-methyltransferase
MSQPESSSPARKRLAQAPLYTGRLTESPIGPLWVAVSKAGLALVEWNMPLEEFERLVEQHFHQIAVYNPQSVQEPLRQLAAYLAGNLREFSLPLDLSRMTAFQKQVLQLTSQIPYAQTSTYKQIAIQAGKPNAARAVGRVEATNPIPLVIPCHRVLGSDGSLHGYGGPGGIKLKAWLIELEQLGFKKNRGGITRSIMPC